jgi:DNA-directed RNA polymerase specialized sigma24 family protein
MFEWVRGRVARLASWRLGRDPRVRRWHETDDVLQEMIRRLCQKHRNGWTPNTTDGLLLIATITINRVLWDLARGLYGPEGLGANHASNPGSDGRDGGASDTNARIGPIAQTDDPVKLAEWAEFHEWVETLPPIDQKLVGLILYQGRTRVHAAAELEVSVKTVARHWERLAKTIVTLLPDS